MSDEDIEHILGRTLEDTFRFRRVFYLLPRRLDNECRWGRQEIQEVYSFGGDMPHWEPVHWADKVALEVLMA